MTRCPQPHCRGTLYQEYEPDSRAVQLACRLCGRSPTPPPPHVQPVHIRSLPRMQGDTSRAGR